MECSPGIRIYERLFLGIPCHINIQSLTPILIILPGDDGGVAIAQFIAEHGKLTHHGYSDHAATSMIVEGVPGDLFHGTLAGQ